MEDVVQKRDAQTQWVVSGVLVTMDTWEMDLLAPVSHNKLVMNYILAIRFAYFNL